MNKLTSTIKSYLKISVYFFLLIFFTHSACIASTNDWGLQENFKISIIDNNYNKPVSFQFVKKKIMNRDYLIMS